VRSKPWAGLARPWYWEFSLFEDFGRELQSEKSVARCVADGQVPFWIGFKFAHNAASKVAQHPYRFCPRGFCVWHMKRVVTDFEPLADLNVK
jgi:hypothetical protein